MFAQSSEVANSCTDGDGFDVRDITDDLKGLHMMSLPFPIRTGKLNYAPSQLKNGIAGKPASNPSAYEGLVEFATPIIIKKFK